LQRSDAELVQQIRNGDELAFKELVNRHSDYLYGLAYSQMGNAADAEDVLQETLLGAFRRFEAFEGRSAVKTWLVRILLNHASKLQRSRRVRRAMSLPDELGPKDGAGDRLNPSSPAAIVEGKADLDLMLQVLSEEHRQVIVLRELQQMSYDEIAQTLKIPRGTVESRLHRARHELKRRFAGYLEGTAGREGSSGAAEREE
jgi:RNA polymerase sigma-70 factor (ECF subfamily)